MSSKIILASASPRRREIMENAGYDFTVRVADADETLPDNISPEKAVIYLARLKGNAVSAENGETVISADTVVVLDGRILGKPKDKTDAVKMLTELSGKTHRVYTGVCVRQGAKEKVFSVCTEVIFYPLKAEEITEYVDTGEPMDKAGAYGIQGKGALLVKEIHGDYNNVVGLPIAELSRVLEEFGIKRK